MQPDSSGSILGGYALKETDRLYSTDTPMGKKMAAEMYERLSERRAEDMRRNFEKQVDSMKEFFVGDRPWGEPWKAAATKSASAVFRAAERRQAERACKAAKDLNFYPRALYGGIDPDPQRLAADDYDADGAEEKFSDMERMDNPYFKVARAMQVEMDSRDVGAAESFAEAAVAAMSEEMRLKFEPFRLALNATAADKRAADLAMQLKVADKSFDNRVVIKRSAEVSSVKIIVEEVGCVRKIEIEIPLTAVSDALFDSKVNQKPIDEEVSAPELADANAELAAMSQDVKNDQVYGIDHGYDPNRVWDPNSHAWSVKK